MKLLIPGKQGSSDDSETRDLNGWGRRTRKGLPWPGFATREDSRAPAPRSKRKREVDFLIKSQNKAQLAAHLVLGVRPNVLPHKAARTLSLGSKGLHANGRTRGQAALPCLWLCESQKLRFGCAVA